MISTTTAFKAALAAPVDASKIKIEVYFSAGTGWVDITDWVETASGVQEETPATGGTVNANTLNLTLINDDGRFSPNNTAGPYTGLLTPNKAIRVSSVFGPDSVWMFAGWTSNWIPSAKARTCQVVAEDTCRILKRKTIVEETIFNPTNLTAGYYLTTVLERAAWLSGLRWDTANTSTDVVEVGSITLTAGGSGYADGTYPLGFSGGGGSGAAGTYAVYLGVVTGLTITNPGSGYSTPPAVSFPSGGGSSAAATATLTTLPWALASQTNPDASVTSITVNKSGGVTQATYTQAGALVMNLDLVSLTLPCTPVTGLCLDNLAQICQVADGRLWFDAQGVMVFRCRMYQNDTALSSVQTFTIDSFDDVMAEANFETSKYNQICNRATISGTPWAFAVDANGNVVPTVVPFLGALFSKHYFNAGEKYPDYTGPAADLYCTMPSNVRMVKTTSPVYPTATNVTVTSAPTSDIANTKAGGIVFFSGIEGINLTAGGSGFANSTYALGIGAPPAGGTQATGTYTTTGGAVTSIQLINTGQGYTSAPAITFPSGGGAGATATAIWESFPVFEQTRMKLAFVNTGSTAQQFQTLSLSVNLMAPLQAIKAVRTNTASIALYDYRDKAVTNNMVPNAAAGEQLASWLVTDGAAVKDYLTLPIMYGCPWLELGDKITVSETIINTQPTAKDVIVKRITWRWAFAAFAYALEACTQSPAFQASSLPATAVKISTSTQSQNGAIAGAQGPQWIDGTSGMVGLNSTMAFQGLMNGSKGVPSGLTSSFGIGFDGKDIYIAQSLGGKTINRIDTMTGANTWTASSLNNTDSLYSVAISGSLLFVTDVVNNSIQVTSTTAATAGTCTLKASLGTRVPCEIFFVGTKMYVITRDSGTNLAEVCVWDSINSTNSPLNAPDHHYSLGTFSHLPVRSACNGTTIYVPNSTTNTVASFNTTTLAITANVLSSSITAGIMAMAWDGLYLWASTNAGTIYRLTPGTSGYTILTTATVPHNAIALLFDGMYVWGSGDGVVYQLSTTGILLGTYATSSTSGAPFVFDGLVIWQAGGNGDTNLYRVPRLVAGRQF